MGDNRRTKRRGEGVSRAILVVISPPLDSRYLEERTVYCDIEFGSIRSLSENLHSTVSNVLLLLLLLGKKILS